MEIFKHKKTNQFLGLKSKGPTVSTYYALNDQQKKVIEKNPNGVAKTNVDGSMRFEMAICVNSNVEKVQ